MKRSVLLILILLFVVLVLIFALYAIVGLSPAPDPPTHTERTHEQTSLEETTVSPGPNEVESLPDTGPSK